MIQEGANFMIRFHCEHCGHKISVQDKHAAKRGKCPKCDGVVVVPYKSTIVEFACQNCGQKINVPEIHAGKKAKCPKCNSRVSIPEPQTAGVTTDQGTTGDTEPAPKPSPHSLTLLDISQKIKAQSQPAEQPVPDEIAYEQLRRLQGGRIAYESDEIPQRKLPWIIDIFLYPISKPGLMMLGLIILMPLFLKFLKMTFYFAMLYLPVLLIVFLLVVFVSVITWIVLSLYFYWYFCECIRESAAGHLRAPETMGSAPGLGDMLRRLLRLLGCLAVFFAPVLIRFRYTGTVDVVFWSLLSYAVFFFPMAILAVVMFDSFQGLNPFLLIGSIFSTFFQYCALVLFIAAGVFVLLSVPIPRKAIISRFILHCVSIYMALVAAHLLGRFYWRYQEKLNWEV